MTEQTSRKERSGHMGNVEKIGNQVTAKISSRQRCDNISLTFYQSQWHQIKAVPTAHRLEAGA